jgi:hypothetical protein
MSARAICCDGTGACCDADADCGSDTCKDTCIINDKYCDTSSAYTCKTQDDYVTGGKVCYVGVEINPTFSVNCGVTNDCTAGACTGTKYYRSCQPNNGLCRSDITGATPETVYAAATYTLTSSCGTAGTTPCGYSAWNGCTGSCTKKRDEYRCTSSQSCSYDAGDNTALVSAGKVCSGGLEIAPTTSIYCNIYNDCAAGSCSGRICYTACDSGGACRSNCNNAAETPVYAQNGYSLTTSCGTAGTTLCGYSSYNACTGSGNPYTCQKKRDQLRCNGATHACSVDVGDDVGNVASGNVCTGSGTETAGSSAYYSSQDAPDRCSAPSDPNTGFGDRVYDVFACDGSGGVSGPDVGDRTTD